MQSRSFAPSYSRRGFYIIGILIVVAIILILVFKGSMAPDPVTQVSSGITYIDRSQEVACSTNRNAIRTDLQHYQINNPGAPITPDVIRKANSATCPDGGIYLMAQDGHIFCTLHDPPPPEQMQQLMRISEEKPVATPVGTPDPYAGATPQATPMGTPDPYGAR
ncbi:MAG TPA: hypothetical protein PLS90_13910 [Candidatus Sumerlaeota bacterium]|nr:MAG: hypothetical protein BWZ08_01553 [candidate division BRC1 bacterium ADurb.BinA292]HOE97630.1 hypothetical protein [Candidatus Sumerlaeota bacterium]HOR29384.1 hypothetical protein [Candidatus Sumerlaeota bacterium]HPK03539.1 hypothetical protein [Candidatus Sumerlaeota bacterium]